MINKGVSVLVFLLLSLLASCTANTGLEKEVIETRYQVNKDLSLSVISGELDDVDINAWNKVISILPNDVIQQQVIEYYAFSDGIDNYLAFVEIHEKNPSKWAFAVDYEDAINPHSDDFVSIVIHEFAHILSLESTQVQREYDKCMSYELDEGCANPDSYLNEFYTAFWQGELFNEHQVLTAELNEEEKQEVIAQFFKEHPDLFVSEYASTNPPEDFAETFMFFVLSDKVANPSSIKDEKINFFYGYPKLVAIREYIRNQTSIRK